MKFLGNCDLEDGQFLSFYTSFRNICNQDQRSLTARTKSFDFDQPGQNMEDLYDIDLRFTADSSCGNQFLTRVALYRKTLQGIPTREKLYFQYQKELSFIPNSFRAIHNVDANAVFFRILDDLESVEIGIEPLAGVGDSVVFELVLERTCIEQCKSTDFSFLLNAPRDVNCAHGSGGMCIQYIQVQGWNFDSIVISPSLYITDSDLESQVLGMGQERLTLRYQVENRSPFTGAVDYIIRFYYDVNGDGRIDASDQALGTDTIPGLSIGANTSIWQTAVLNAYGISSCRLLAEVNPLDNPCLCLGDTLKLVPPRILGEKKVYRICHDQNLNIGFDSVAGYRYQWDKIDRIDRDTSPQVVYRYPGNLQPASQITDTLYLEVRKARDCSYYDTAIIEVYRIAADLIQLDSVLCYGDKNARITADGLGSTGPWQYRWEGLSQTSREVGGLGVGSYRVTVTDNMGCSAVDSIVITEPDSLTDVLRITSDYNGFAIRCHDGNDGSVKVHVSGGTPGYTYQWSNGEKTDSIGGLSEGWLRLKVLDRHGCPIEDSIYLGEPPPIVLEDTTGPAGCDEAHGGFAEVRAQGGVPLYRYLWSTGDTTASVSSLMSGRYTVTVIDENLCRSEATMEVDQLPDPWISLNIQDTTVLLGEILRLRARSNAQVPNYRWTPAGLVDCDSCETVHLEVLEKIWVEVLVTDENGCQSLARVLIDVKIIKDVWVPNVFSPNGDDINDLFTIYGNPALEEVESLEIYDRWGELIWRGGGFPPNEPRFGWDGRFRNSDMNPAVFVYKAMVRFVDGETRVLAGDLTLIR